METCKISLQACSTGVGLGVKITFDKQTIYDHVVGSDPALIEHDFSDEDGVDHELIIELLGKTPQHTVIDTQGNIISDSLLEIKNLALDGIDLTAVLNKVTQYHHDGNGTDLQKQHEFFGSMGCNGQVVLRFSSPVYLWLLENI